jgi:hypothetical protein
VTPQEWALVVLALGWMPLFAYTVYANRRRAHRLTRINGDWQCPLCHRWLRPWMGCDGSDVPV